MTLDWARAFAGDGPAQAQWQPVDGGAWTWGNDAVQVCGTGPEWVALRWTGWSTAMAQAPDRFLLEVTVSGQAEAAGLSFGGYKDFLTPVEGHLRPRRLELEVDAAEDRWAFRVDGQLRPRCWWDAAVTGVQDLLQGELRLKTRHAQQVAFRNLSIRPFESRCRLSVVITCSGFLQRLRLALRNWCHQEAPAGTHEILVVNPQSPDGTQEHLAAVGRSYPHLRVREVPVASRLATNKGAMINRGFAVSRGEWIWLTDADCLFGPDSITQVLAEVRERPARLYFGERRFLTSTQTDALLAGRFDSLRDFDELTPAAVARQPERHHWGYTQIVHRSTMERVRYSEAHNHFAHSDGEFAEACRRAGAVPQSVEGLFCLHLDHPFSWYGAKTFL